MNFFAKGALGALLLGVLSSTALAETTLTIATVNNGDMIRMQGLMDDFYAKHPDIKVEWVTLEENVLRQKVTTDIATKGGQFDVLTIGTYEVPIWGKQGWLASLNDLPAEYDVDDLLPAIRGGEKAATKPWDGAEGLEWTVPSPAPFHTFETPPTVK